MKKYVESMPGYVANDRDVVDALIDKAYAQLMSYLYLENSDQDKYGSILTGLTTQKTLKNDQYPKTITDASDVLSCHKFDQASRRKTNNNKRNDPNKRKDPKDDVKPDETPSMSFAQLEGRCY